MKNLSLIPFSLLLFFATNNNGMDLIPHYANNLNSTTEEGLLKIVAVPAIIVESDNPNPLKRTHENAFTNDTTGQSKKQCLENKKLTSRPFSCTECNATFTNTYYFSRHLKIHTNEKPFICKKCNKAFSRKSILTTHKRTHSNKKPFICTECNKAFTNKNDLTTHKKTHRNEKPYTCTQCNKSFTLKGYLTKHVKTHTNEKPFPCSECNKTFTLKGNLSRHLKTHANQLKPQEIKY